MKQKSDKESDWRILDGYRKDIDEIDRQILSRLSRRQDVAAEIGKLKRDLGFEIMDHAREQEVLRRLVSNSNKNLSADAIRAIYSEIISAARSAQQVPTVAYLGPEATFTHIAAINHFGRSVTYVPQTSIQDIFREVEKGAYHFGVVPVENSIEGAANYTLDLFAESDLKICAEIYHNISQDLLSKSGSIDEIQTVYSHPQAFAQCRRWLRDHLPNCVLKEISSTAEAARKASEEEGALHRVRALGQGVPEAHARHVGGVASESLLFKQAAEIPRGSRPGANGGHRPGGFLPDMARLPACHRLDAGD